MEINKLPVLQQPSTVDKLIAVAKSPVGGLLLKGAILLLTSRIAKR